MLVNPVDQLGLSAIDASSKLQGDSRSAIDLAAMPARRIYARALGEITSRPIEIQCRNREGTNRSDWIRASLVSRIQTV